jgi:26S proteasome regulatory subunit N3
LGGGIDSTIQFESYHVNAISSKILDKYCLGPVVCEDGAVEPKSFYDWKETSQIRKLLPPSVLGQWVTGYLGHCSDQNTLLAHLDAAAKKSSSGGDGNGNFDGEVETVAVCPLEVDIYLRILVLSQTLSSKLSDEMCLAGANGLYARLSESNKPTVAALIPKALSLYSQSFENAGRLDEARVGLLAAHRRACINHEHFSQAVSTNLILRNFIHYDQYEQAFKFVENNKTFPDFVSNNQFVRYLYYVGMIQAIHLDYSDAYTKLMQAIRKAPKTSHGNGFEVSAKKLACIVQLLMGEIPDMSFFKDSNNSERIMAGLMPYLEVAKSVRQGDLTQFNAVLVKHAAEFKRDNTHSMVLRLRHNVIKTGLRKISNSYSQISLEDICTKLCLYSVEDAEYVCQKAIFDSVISGTIDHDAKVFDSQNLMDIYSTSTPRDAFHDRIGFCLALRNETVRSLRYPPKEKKTEEKKKDDGVEEENDEEIAAEILDEEEKDE